MRARGFILQASYRVQGGAPVVHLYGKLTDGATFLVRDHRQTPSFFIAAADAERAAALGATRTRSVQRRTFDGRPALEVEVAIPADAPPLRDRLHAESIDTFEADVRFAVRYLIDRNVKGGVEIEGECRRGEGSTWVFDDPEVRPAAVVVEPTVLSFDIETDPTATSLTAIALYGCGLDEVLIVDPAGRSMPDRARGFASEADALAAFRSRVLEVDPDVLTGWNVIDFDLTVLAKIAAKRHVSFELGRDPGRLTVRAAQGYFGSGQANIPGRLVLDGMDLVRGAFVRMEDFSLDTVAREVLGEGKAVAGEVGDRVGEIMHNYANDLDAFAFYARTDARLALDVVDKLNLVPLSIARSALTGMTPDRVAASIASFDFLYLAELGRRGIVAPSVRSSDSRVSVAQAGGHVLEPVTGIHENVWVFDFKSLYPSIIRTFNIDPLGFLEAQRAAPEDLLTLPDGARFLRSKGILPTVLDELFPRREAAKQAGDGVASQAIKILMNSFYGVLGTPACRFHNAAVANAITAQGRHLLKWSQAWFEERDYRVLYGDTDSLFVASAAADVESARALGFRLNAELNAAVGAYITAQWGVESRLELEFEKLYEKLFLPSVRHGGAGARKRYAGLIAGSAATDVEFVGMEVVRRDWTELAKRVQRELYYRLFAALPVAEYLENIVKQLRHGALDETLVYRKGLRKNLDSYTASTPPHVAAARKSREKPGRVIAYVMTTAGPEPLDNLTHALDLEHYVQKQVRPVAEPVLDTLGMEFAQVIGDDRQLELF